MAVGSQSPLAADSGMNATPLNEPSEHTYSRTLLRTDGQHVLRHFRRYFRTLE